MNSAEKRNSSCNGWKLKVKLEKKCLLPTERVCLCACICCWKNWCRGELRGPCVKMGLSSSPKDAPSPKAAVPEPLLQQLVSVGMEGTLLCIIWKVTLQKTIAVPRLQNFRVILPSGFFPCWAHQSSCPRNKPHTSTLKFKFPAGAMGRPRLRAGYHGAESMRRGRLVPGCLRGQPAAGLRLLSENFSPTFPARIPGESGGRARARGKPAAWEGMTAHGRSHPALLGSWYDKCSVPCPPSTYTAHCWKHRLFFGPSTRYFPLFPSRTLLTLSFAIWVRSCWLRACMGDAGLTSPGFWPSPLPIPTEWERIQMLQLLLPASIVHFWREALSISFCGPTFTCALCWIPSATAFNSEPLKSSISREKVSTPRHRAQEELAGVGHNKFPPRSYSWQCECCSPRLPGCCRRGYLHSRALHWAHVL